VTDAEQWLEAVRIDAAVTELRPDYRALVLVAEGLRPGPSDEVSERHLAAAEHQARAMSGGGPAETQPHLAAWREAFQAFGAKPKRTRPSVEALLHRLPDGLPRIDRLTDLYNAVSVAHVVPLGGEDLDHYRGPARLVRADGTEPFEVVAGGEPAVEHPRSGEVVWRDDEGITCRRWNWRQCARTRLTHETTRAFFVLDALGPMTDGAVHAAGEALTEALLESSPGATVTSRLVGH
jgi:DNA/RNA-binding domain of Phe-tRNA-synthetase-like protein